MKKNVVIISTLRIFPPESGGQRRTASIATSLAKNGYSVHLYSLTDRKGDRGESCANLCSDHKGEIFERVKSNPCFTLMARIGYRLGLPPLWIFLRLWLGPSKDLRELLPSAQILIADFPYTWPIFKYFNGTKILNTHNVEHHLENAFFRRIFIRPLIKMIEDSGARRANFIFCCGDQDKAYFEEIKAPKAKTIVISNGVDRDRFYKDHGERLALRNQLSIADDDLVLFFPASAYGPNLEGYTFISDFSQKNQDLLAKLKIKIVVTGSVCKTPFVLGALVVTGPVPKIEPYFNMSDALINPIFHGSGTSIKVGEAIAASLPIITTKIGARGYDFLHGESAFFFSDEDDLLEIVKELRAYAKKFIPMGNLAQEANKNIIDNDMGIKEFLRSLG